MVKKLEALLPIEKEFEIVRDWFDDPDSDDEWSPQVMIEHPHEGKMAMALMVLPWEDEDQKIMMLRLAAVQAASLKATRIRLLADVWMSSAKVREYDPTVMPRDDPNHEEVVIVLTVSEHDQDCWGQSYGRDDEGKRVWGEVFQLGGPESTGLIVDTFRMRWEMPEPPPGMVEMLGEMFGLTVMSQEIA